MALTSGYGTKNRDLPAVDSLLHPARQMLVTRRRFPCRPGHNHPTQRTPDRR
jgi:hypothetical protein